MVQVGVALNGAELGPLLERLAERYPGSLVIVERDARGDFAILWANAAAVERLDHLTVRALLDDRDNTTVQLACADAIATDCMLELDLRPSHTLSGCITIIPLGPRRLAIELCREPRSLELSIAGELKRQRDARFEMLFSQSLNSIFFMTLDEPIRWNASADRAPAAHRVQRCDVPTARDTPRAAARYRDARSLVG